MSHYVLDLCHLPWAWWQQRRLRLVQITMSRTPSGDTLYALDRAGRLWKLTNGIEWAEIPPPRRR